jgi:hypothetical protein
VNTSANATAIAVFAANAIVRPVFLIVLSPFPTNRCWTHLIGNMALPLPPSQAESAESAANCVAGRYPRFLRGARFLYVRHPRRLI